MIKIKYIFLFMAMMATGLNAFGQSANDDAALRKKVNDAVMKVYNEQLEKEPNDYSTLLARAYQWFNFGDYDKALADAQTVTKNAPEKEKDVRFDAYLLCANVYDARNQYQDEYNELKNAAELKPTNAKLVDMMGKVAYKLGDYKSAKSNFNAILRQSPQNFDALYNLAKVAVKQNDLKGASEYCNRAQSLFPSEPEVYLNNADIYNMMGEYELAAKCIILAMSMTNDTRKPISALVTMSDEHYTEVCNALQTGIDANPQSGMFYYIRSQIAMSHLHYAQALADLKSINDGKLFDDASVLISQAQCEFELCKYDDALNTIDKALAKNASNVDALVTKARIIEQQAGGNNYDPAMGMLLRAARIDKGNPDVLMEQALIYIAQHKDNEALTKLDAVIAANNLDFEALLIRGWLNKYRLKNAEAALADFNKIADAGKDMMSFKGFALHELGRDLDATKWAQQIIKDEPLPGGQAYAYAAALLSMIGDNNQAIINFESALANGYGSLYEVNVNENPYVNFKQLRSNPEFKSIVERYQANFSNVAKK